MFCLYSASKASFARSALYNTAQHVWNEHDVVKGASKQQCEFGCDGLWQ